MDFRDSAAEAEFRAEVREWLAANLPRNWPDEGQPTTAAQADKLRRWWQEQLHEAGWVGISWPRQYGGRGGTLTQQLIFNEEAARAQAPEPLNTIGLYMAGPTIIDWGSEEQKRRYLPPLLSGEEIWCQGFSEPGAGSDLGSLRTRAVRDGDHYVVDGQKVWTSYGHLASFCILLARSDPQAPKHAGLTYLILDMGSDGVSVRPLVQITGDAEFNEVFFDSVVVPAANRLGEEGQGWRVAMTTLAHERGTMSVGLQVMSQITLDALGDLCRRLGVDQDPGVRERLAAFHLQVEALRITNLRGMGRAGGPGPEGSMAKLLWERVQQDMGEFAVELLGVRGLVHDGPEAVDGGRWLHRYLRGRAHSIEAGTTEVLKSIIAERVLGLPRSR